MFISTAGEIYHLLEQRYFIELSFKGTAYHGWQVQPNAISVQQTIEEAVSTLIREKMRITGAGRTDTGVHAGYFAAHFSTSSNLIYPLRETIRKLNYMLPHDIAIIDIFPVRDNYHSRFSAISRTYKYYLSRRKNPFTRETSYHNFSALDVRAMKNAAAELLKYNDFRSFCRTSTNVKSYICRIMHADWEEKDDVLIFTITANRFLRNMVRAIVGTVLDVGYGKITVDDFKKIIEAGDRCKAGTSAPAGGLFLEAIEYPPELFSQKENR